MKNQKTIKCKKCGKILAPDSDMPYQYCNEYLVTIDDAIEKGAIILRRISYRHSSSWTISQDYPKGKCVYISAPQTQVAVIVKGRKVAKKLNVPVIFEYQKHASLWFLDDYLDAHPNIKRSVEQAEVSIIDRIKTKLSKDKSAVA